MEYNEFLNRVQQVGDLNSEDEAKDAVRATFTTFALRMPADATDELSSFLPPELDQYFARTRDVPAEDFSLDSFFARVNEQQGLDMPTTSQYVRAVMSALREDLAPDQFLRLRSALPDEFISMFDTGGESSMIAGS